jgi:DNA-binding NarL/FixJ family response regulator
MWFSGFDARFALAEEEPGGPESTAHYFARMPADERANAIQQGQDALWRGAWAEARERFARALALEATADAFEGLGAAARYELDAGAAIDAHERGYRMAREGGDAASAARLAIQLAYDAYAFRGPAEASGWIERAAMLVDGEPPSVAAAWVPLLRAHLALLAEDDAGSARVHSARAIALAREVGAIDVEMQALGLNGLALLSAGDIEEGMRRVDAAAAAAIGGEMRDADSIETVCCYAIDACKRVRDLERANEWCLRVREIATRFADRQMFSVCRTHYADVLMWHGDFERAERELTAAIGELEAIRPGREVEAVVRLAELRRRQGRTGEAEELLARAASHRLHVLVEGLLALDRGDVETALDAAARFLRRLQSDGEFERVVGLELRVRATLAGGDVASATEAAQEIGAIAAAAQSALLRAAALLAQGRIALARQDAEAAPVAIEDAADLFDAAGATYEAALARLDLASALRAAGRDEPGARVEARARRALSELGVRVAEVRAGGLSPREAEVLRLVARGLSNDDIAAQLVLSVRTVERHVANVYAKIGASGRTARAIATAWAHAHGIT